MYKLGTKIVEVDDHAKTIKSPSGPYWMGGAADVTRFDDTEIQVRESRTVKWSDSLSITEISITTINRYTGEYAVSGEHRQSDGDRENVSYAGKCVAAKKQF